MQVSTSNFYADTGKRMSAMTQRAQTLQTEIATGKKIQTPSDAPGVSQQLAEIAKKDANSAVYADNMKTAGSLLDQADSVIKQITAQLTHAKELATSAATGTQSASERKIIGAELDSVLGSLIGLANINNIRGEPLFGTPGSVKAVVDNGDGTYTYTPTNVSPVPIADGQDVQATESAGRLFQLTDGTDVLATLQTLAKALQTSDPDSQATANGSLDTIQQGLNQLGDVQASVGARGARIDLQQQLLQTADTDRTELRSKLEDTDIPSAVVELQQMLTALQATQASFSKLAQLSLFDYIR
ncbi:flagellar hook-associated protein 3 [Sphingomonas metalli]|uniref:Flagellin n=1 Tax=Sphingomonas metalli TaxID=1779358 RepID=A0A916SZ35_9SPHN|nr:flagellin [Sphingomonas metalli]GGB23721.1 flagellar hook-associated protein 3 [Sphingomonas metalli]